MITFKEYLNLLFESELLIENRIQFIKDNNKNLNADHDPNAEAKTSDEIVDHIANHVDPTRNKTHTQWLVKQYKNQKFKQEDSHDINQTLQHFEKHKSKLEKKDINGYKSIDDVRDAVNPHIGSAATNKEKKHEIVQQGLEKVHDTGDKQVYHVKTKAASQAVYSGGHKAGGTHTSWCTAADSDECRFDQYNKKGPLHTIHVKGDENSPYQVHTHTDKKGITAEFKNRRNEGVDVNEFAQKHKDLVGSELGNHHIAFADSKQLDKHIKSEDASVRREVVKHPNLSKEHLDHLSRDEDYYVRRAVAEHPNLSKEHLDHLSRDEDWGVRRRVAKHPNATKEHLDHLSKDENVDVRREVANHPNLSKEHLDRLSRDEDYYVRSRVAKHPNATKEHLDHLSRDKDRFVRDAAEEQKRKRGLQEQYLSRRLYEKSCNCWTGYKRVPGTKPCTKGSCVKETNEGLEEATYQGKEVPLNKPLPGDVKKSKVYVRDPETGNIKKVNFGDKSLSIKKHIPQRKKSYCARSSGQGNLTDKTSANYWSRKAWDC